jgi:peptide/nickel transport system substrate-binding protein
MSNKMVLREEEIMKRYYSVFTLIIVFALLVGCSPAATQPPAANTQLPSPTQALVENKPTEAPPPVVSRPIVIIQSDDPSSGDPAENWAFGGAAYLPQVYETLFRFVGESSPKLEPLLAAQVPTKDNGGISSDGLVYTIKMVPNAKFHDGSPVNADAVIYSYDRIKSLKFGANGITADYIDKMEKIDDTTVKFTLTKPFSDFLNSMGSVWGNYIVNPKLTKANEKNSDWGHDWIMTNDAGSGPYSMANFDTANKQITLERFKDYWGGWKIDHPIDKAILRWLKDPTGARVLIEKGDADIAVNLPATDFSALEKAQGFISKKYPSIMQYYLAFNGSVKPLDDNRVRQALQFSFNRDKVISDIFNGNLIPMQAAVGPGYPDVYPATTQYDFSLEGAKTLLTGTSQDNKIKLVANMIGAMPNDQAVLEFWQADLAKIGVDLQIQQMDYGVWSKSWFDDCTAATAPKIGNVSALAVGGDYPSAWEVLAQVYPTPRLGGGKCSAVYLNNPAVNDLFKKITDTVDPQQRQVLFQDLYDTIAKDAGAIWLGQGVDLVTMRDAVQGYQYFFSRGGNYVPLAQMSLSK